MKSRRIKKIKKIKIMGRIMRRWRKLTRMK